MKSFFLVGLGILLGVSGTLAYLDLTHESIYDYNTEVLQVNRTVLETRQGTQANGFYSYDGYFCVVTKDRSLEEITRTTVHELAHLFVHDDPEHFLSPELVVAAERWRR